MVLYGYRIKTTDIYELEQEMKKVQTSINKIAKRSYAALLGEEAAFLCDCITLELVQRSSEETIYDSAIKNVSMHMAAAKNLYAKNKYNFQVYVHIFSDGEYSYINVNCMNPIFLSAFKKLEEFGVSEQENKDEHNQKLITWQKLFKTYGDTQPFTINMTPEVDPYEKEFKLKYPDYKDRCEMMARHAQTNLYLNQVAGGGQIPPFRLIREIDTAMEMLLQEEAFEEQREKMRRLSKILIHLEEDDSIIRTLPGQTAEQEDKEDKSEES